MFPKIWKTETVELLDKDGKILATLNHVPGLYGLSKKIHVSTFLQDYIHNVTPALLAFNVVLFCFVLFPLYYTAAVLIQN